MISCISHANKFEKKKDLFDPNWYHYFESVELGVMSMKVLLHTAQNSRTGEGVSSWCNG